MVPPVSGPFRGSAQGRAQGSDVVIRKPGGGSQQTEAGGSHPPRPLFAAALRVVRPRPDDPNRASGEGEDGSDPPFFTAGAVRRRGVDHTGFHTRYHTPLRLRWGRSRPHVSLLEGSPARTRAGRRAVTSGAMIDRLLRALLVIGGVSAACAWTWPGAFPEGDPVAVLVRYHTPNVYTAVVAWYYVAPGVAALLAAQFLVSTSRIWFARMGVSLGLRSRLPSWPLSPSADGPAIVIGEVHHPVKLDESPTPEWLTIPERGLYTGVAIFGAVGSGKTSACMHPFARQLLSWHADNPERRAAALVLEVKGDFCHDIRRMLTELDRGEDYIELSLDGRLTWNPLSATWLDSYSLAYTVASLLESTLREGQRTVLATGLHESGPLDHRAVPGAAAPRTAATRPDG